MSQNGLLLLFPLCLLTIMVTTAVNGCTLKGETKTFLSDMSDKMMLDQLLNRTCYDKRIRPSEGLHFYLGGLLQIATELSHEYAWLSTSVPVMCILLSNAALLKPAENSTNNSPLSQLHTAFSSYTLPEFAVTLFSVYTFGYVYSDCSPETIFALRYLCTGASEGCFSPSKHAILPIVQYLLHTPTLLLLGTTVINISVLVLSLASPDESSLQYEVEFLVHQRWKDARLRFEHRYTGDHEHLNGIHHKEALWLPDTYFLKHGESRQIPTPSDIALRIFKDGTVHYTMRSRLNLQCKGNLKIFPFDHPACFFGIESISHEDHEILFNWSSIEAPLVFVPQYHSLNAYITKNFTKTCDESVIKDEEKRSSWRGNYSCLKVEMIFKRDSSFYFSTVFIPGMLLVSSSFITFWLEWNAVPGRVMLGVTTMLNFFTTSNNFRSGLPVVANLTAMNVWDGVCMCFIYASLLEFVAVNYLGRKKPRSIRALCGTIGPRLLVTYLRLFQEPTKQEQDTTGVGNHDSSDCSVCPPNQCTHSVPIDGLKEMPSSRRVAEDYLQPIKVAKTIDVLSRVVFPVAYVVFLIYFFVSFQEHDR